MNVTVYQDGKSCRGVEGVLLRRRSNGVMIKFIVDEYCANVDKWMPTAITKWFKRRRLSDGGAYECHELNYWYYPRARQ